LSENKKIRILRVNKKKKIILCKNRILKVMMIIRSGKLDQF